MATYKNTNTNAISRLKTVKGKRGWCLQYCRDVLQSSINAYTATDAYNLAKKYIHTGKDFPIGAVVMVYFKWWGTIDGVYRNWGHVCLYYDGKFYTSPNSAGSTKFDNLTKLCNAFGCTYLGWSEYYGNKQIAKKVDEPKTSYTSYTIKSGDTLTSIAKKYSTTIDKIAKANGIKNPDLIYAGNKLKIPK